MRGRRGRRSRRSPHPLALLAVTAVGLAGLSGTALTAGLSDVPSVSADQKVQAVSSFSAGLPSYDDSGGSTVVTFTVTPSAGQARARVATASTPDPPYETCSSTDGGGTWTCPVPGLSAADASAGTFQWVAAP